MKTIKKHGVSIFFFMIVFGCIYLGFHNTQQSTSEHQKQSLEEALYRGIMECYAIEGRYPESVAYLINEYHIIYDKEAFDIDYEIVASNIMPHVLVLEK